MTDAPAADNALLSRLHLIEAQPLESRAEALGVVVDDLRSMLEAGDAGPSA